MMNVNELLDGMKNELKELEAAIVVEESCTGVVSHPYVIAQFGECGCCLHCPDGIHLELNASPHKARCFTPKQVESIKNSTLPEGWDLQEYGRLDAMKDYRHTLSETIKAVEDRLLQLTNN